MYFITTKRMLEVCFSAHPNIQYRTHFPVRRVQGTAKRRAARQTMAVQPQLRPAKAAKRKMVHRSTASHSSV